MVLRRDVANRAFEFTGGVCAGLGKYLGVDTILIRLAFVCAFIWAGVGPLLYLILWLIVPPENGE